MARRKNRRDFLKTSAVAGAGFWVAGTALGKEKKNPIETVRFASIGVAGKGGSHGRRGQEGTSWSPSAMWTKRLGDAAKKSAGETVHRLSQDAGRDGQEHRRRD